MRLQHFFLHTDFFSVPLNITNLLTVITRDFQGWQSVRLEDWGRGEGALGWKTEGGGGGVWAIFYPWATEMSSFILKQCHIESVSLPKGLNGKIIKRERERERERERVEIMMLIRQVLDSHLDQRSRR